mmetsp:Transcript_54944/g.154128  ORF Transcript_54944/g.154128 Transcript_54944/m.154128 type:complete len:205 (-) Transcript_54944:12-626(-)
MSSFNFTEDSTARLLASTLPCSANSSACFSNNSDEACISTSFAFTTGGNFVTLPGPTQFAVSRDIHASASRTSPSRKSRNSFSYSRRYLSRSLWLSKSVRRRSEWILLHGWTSFRLVLWNQLSCTFVGQKPIKYRLQTSLAFHPSVCCCSSRDLSRLGPISESSSARASCIAPRRREARPQPHACRCGAAPRRAQMLHTSGGMA